MSKLIEFHVPTNFKTPQRKWIPESERGKVIAFHGAARKSA